jgi:hypothetical protein
VWEALAIVRSIPKDVDEVIDEPIYLATVNGWD